MTKPLVSICCLAYNHEPFIRECLDGFMMQKTDFAFEVLIHDDASTDRTGEIIKEYEKKYPDIIKPIYQTENQYSKGVGVTRVYNFPRAKGKYIAMCEGDDYWTDPYKLQKQADFLEKNEEYSLCTSGYIKYNIQTKKSESIIDVPKNVIQSPMGYTFGLSSTKWITKTLTVLFRYEDGMLDSFPNYKYFRDVHLFYHLLKKGKGFYFTETMGVYNMHEGGVHSLIEENRKIEKSYLLYKELWVINKDSYTRKKHLVATINYLNYLVYNRNESLRSKRKLFLEAIKNIRSFDEVKILTLSLFSRNFKEKVKNVFKR